MPAVALKLYSLLFTTLYVNSILCQYIEEYDEKYYYYTWWEMANLYT